MSELAINYGGQRFLLPREALFWRVRRMRDGQRGQLDIVRDVDGQPLIVPIDINHEDFRGAVEDQEGRYRLDALDEDKLALKNVDPAYVTVPTARRPVAPPMREAEGFESTPHASATVTAPFGSWPAVPMAMTGAEYLLAEALRGQVQMFQTLAMALGDRNASNASGASQMMIAASELVCAAYGAAAGGPGPAGGLRGTDARAAQRPALHRG